MHHSPQAGNRAAELTGLLNAAPSDPTDHEAVGKYIRQLAEAGLAVLFIYPDSKVPADVRIPQQRNADDRKAREAAREAGRRGWGKVRSPAGLALATTDTAVLDGYLKRYVELFSTWVDGDGNTAPYNKKRLGAGELTMAEPVAVNLAVETGGSRLVVIDCDTAAQLERFYDAALPPDFPVEDRPAPTFLTPGQVGQGGDASDGDTWAHRDGGHFWFMVPEGVELPTTVGTMTWPGDDGFAVLWGRRYALIPPSVRPEGAYIAPGEVHDLADSSWLVEAITDYAARRIERSGQRGGEPADGDMAASIDAWAEGVSWASILEPLSWTLVARADSCGCEVWTAPGLHASPKSATAHDSCCTAGRYTETNAPLHIWTDHDRAPFDAWLAERGTATLSKLQAVAAGYYDNDTGAAMDDLDIEASDIDAMVPPGEELPADFGKAAPSGDASASTAKTAVDPLEAEVAKRLLFLRSDREARRRLALTEADEIELPPVTSLRDLLEQADPPVRHRIDQVWPDGGARILCAAAAKSGKTTLEGNLVRSLADGDPFLDVFTVNRTAERIVVIDNEMNAAMLRSWLRKQKVQNLDAVADVVNMRGRAGLFDLGNDRLRDRWVRRLADLGCDFLIFDCLKPVLEAMGLDENRETGRFLYPFDALLAEAGIGDALVMHHMGHASERARGDSTLLGWSDGNWKIVKNEEHPAQPRYFSALDVRDAEQPVPEGLLTFDPATRRLAYAGGDRAETKQNDNTEKRLSEVLNVLADGGTEGDGEMNVTQIKTAVGGKKEVTDAALALAAKRRLVTVRHQGRSKLYRLNPEARDPYATGDDDDSDGDAAPVAGVIEPHRPRRQGPMAV